MFRTASFDRTSRNSHAAAHMQLPHAPDGSVRHRDIGLSKHSGLALGTRHVLQPFNNNSSRSHPALSRGQLAVPALAPMTSQDPRSPQGGMFGWLGRRWSWLSSSAVRSSSRPDASTAASFSSAQQTAEPRPPPTHLIVMVNGLFGSAANWDVMCEQLQQHLPPDTLLHPSKVNAR